MSGRRWRSAANRPSRQARRGWASLYEAPLKKRTTSRVQQKFNSPKISSRESTLSQQSPRTKNPPHAPPSQPRVAPGLFRAKPGPIWVRIGPFRVDSGSIPGFPGPEPRRFGPHSPLPGSPSSPGDVQKLHLLARASKRALFPPISKNRTKYNIIITNNSKFTPLSL